jgi:hypothetical protein
LKERNFSAVHQKASISEDGTAVAGRGRQKQIEVDDEKRRLHAAIDTEPKLLIKADVFN